jgi:protein MpaA
MRSHPLLAGSLALLATACGGATGLRHAVVPPRSAGRGDPQSTRRLMLGRSWDGRPITVVERGDPDSPAKILVVGCIHGSEPAGIAIARRLASVVPPPETDIWTLADLNPDGVSVGTRTDAHGVDLNRNFPYGWQPLDPHGGLHDAGPSALSERESRIAYRLIEHLRPELSIWYHQALDLVDASGGRRAIEEMYARLVSLPLVQLPRYPGSVTTWQNARVGGTAFVVELPAGPTSADVAIRHVNAILTLARSATAAGPS